MSKRLFLGLVSAALMSAASAAPVLIDFESLPDSTTVSNEYAALGLTLQGGLSLTAGFSLNEFDFPPHSGNVVLANAVTASPLALMFAAPTGAMSAWFTHAAALSITAYAADGSLLGTIASASASNFGSSELIDFGFSNAGRVLVESAGDFVLDDLRFDSQVPEPASVALVALALGAAALTGRRAHRQASA